MSQRSFTMKLTQGGYAIRIESDGHGQEITHYRLCRDGMNAITGAICVIEGMIKGEFK